MRSLVVTYIVPKEVTGRPGPTSSGSSGDQMCCSSDGTRTREGRRGRWTPVERPWHRWIDLSAVGRGWNDRGLDRSNIV